MGSFENFAYNVLRLGVKRGRPPVFSAQQFYPAKEERELQEILKRELERLWTAALQVALQGIRDDVSDLAQIRAELSEDFVNNVNGIADKIIGNAQKSLVKFSEMTIGRPYYPGAIEGSIKADWTATFQQLCISADTTAKAKIAQLVSQGKDQGMNKLQIEKLVKSELPADTAHRAELIARTETAKLNNAATMASYREAGIEYYKWLSCIDDRTRESHAKLNGKICAVGRPDVYFEENEENPLKPISHGRAGEGMYIGDPGTDFQCRCTCVPWDPRIDGKFEIKEAPEPKPKEPSKLEIAREETRKAVEKANEAEKKAKILQRKIEIQQIANQRHAARTLEKRNKIKAKWEISHPSSIMPKKFDNMDDVFEFINKIENNKLAIGESKLSRNGDFIYSGSISGANGKTGMHGDIYLSKEKEKRVISAFEKIRNRKALDKIEDYALCTLWHEMTHNRHQFLNHGIGGEILRSTHKDHVYFMETMNEFVARKTMVDFYKSIGVKNLPYPDIEFVRTDTGYDKYVQRFEKAISFFDIKPSDILENVKKELFDGVYSNQKNTIKEVFIGKLGQDINDSELNKICKNILHFNKYEPDLDNFENTILVKIKEDIEKRKTKNKN